MDMHTTPFYAALFGLVFVVLSFRTLLLRKKLKIGIGYGDQPILIRAISAHSNFAEYVPLALMLIFFLETEIHANLFVHVLCITLLFARIIHAYGISQINENYNFRRIGMVVTIGVIISTSTRLIISYIQGITF